MIVEANENVIKSLLNSPNRNEEYITETFFFENRLVCLNSKRQKRRENYGLTSAQKEEINR